MALGLSVATHATAEQLCIGQEVVPGPDGRMLGHLPYAEAAPALLVAAPAGFSIGVPCRVHRDVAADLTRMLIAAKSTPGVGSRLRAISCFRTVAHQRAVFCSQIGPGKRCRDAAERARFVGPPGYSEHATGYAIDFGTRPSPGCQDVDACFAQTPAGRWLIAHAPEYGFELSFPQGNAQGVTWEPWHWRWVGASVAVPGATAARTLFARARTSFPAQPTTPDARPRPVAVPVSPVAPTPPAPHIETQAVAGH
jgi:D-alanyl-D-alanine carboxypeptidase